MVVTNDYIALGAAIIIAILGVAGAYISYMQTKKKNSLKKKDNSVSSSSKMSNSGNSTVTVNIGKPDKLSKDSGNIVSNNQESKEKFIIPSTQIQLRNVYTTLFAENEMLKSEKIEITKCENGYVEGTVTLDEKDIYFLKGTFNNRILTGEYVSLDCNDDERGTINLKLFDDILSGFCSFSKSSFVKDQIRVSPYVWVPEENADLINGTYVFCTDCHNEKKICCCASEEIDMPILLNDESNKIRLSSTKSERLKEFSSVIDNSQIRQMKRSTNSIKSENNNEFSPCHFYDTKKRMCNVYNNRPVDCRLFPFDIIKDENTNDYYIGYYTDLCDRELKDMEKYAHILRPYFFLLQPYAHIITNEKVCEKLSKAKFEKLYKLREFIF